MSPVIRKIFRPRQFTTYQEFCSEAFPPGAVAIESVPDAPLGPTPDGTKYVFDHHHGCYRPATLTACEQVSEFVRSGSHEDLGPMTLLLCDIDEDSQCAAHGLEHPEDVVLPIYRDMTYNEGRIDRSGGLFAYKRFPHMVGKIVWTFRPYRLARAKGVLRTASPREVERIYDKCSWRLHATIHGLKSAREMEPDIRLEVLGEYPGWTFFREIGANARLGVAQRGVRAFVSLTGQHNGRYWYSLGRANPIVKALPLDLLCPFLNDLEGNATDASDRWGGNVNTIIAAPLRGSVIPPSDLADHINGFLSSLPQLR